MAKRFAGCITAHSWNADGTKVALCPNSNEVHIYAKQGSDYVLEEVLAEHDQVVTGIDWAPKTNRIVSCSQDRNAYVWKYENNKWKPTLVILRINRAATNVRWNPDETKFAVASGAKCVSICYFEEENDWWVSKHIKKHKSTVFEVSWHPEGNLIATGAADSKVRVFSAYIKGVDKKADNTPWGSKLPFGEQYAEIEAQGWVHSVQWSPSGSQIAFCSHDSTFSVADVKSGTPTVQVVKHRELPFKCVLWTSETAVVAVGHDNNPTLFQNSGGWKYVKQLDSGAAASGGAAAGAQASAFASFKNKVDKGSTDSAAVETKLNTKHQNCITCIRIYKANGGNVSQYTTSGLDGHIFFWDAPK